MRLVDHVERRRQSEPAWDDARSRHVLAGALARHDAREARGRLARRVSGAAAVAIAVAVAMIVLRATGAPVEALARGDVTAAYDGDGGYAHD